MLNCGGRSTGAGLIIRNWYSHWNFVAYLVYKRSGNIRNRSLEAAILNFPLPVSWEIILSFSVGLLDPENIGLAVEMAFLRIILFTMYN